MTSRLPGLRAIVSELAARAVGLVVPGVRNDLEAMFDARRVYRPTSAREVPGVVNNGLDGRRRAVSNIFVMFLILFAKWYLAVMGQAPMILSGFVEPAILDMLQMLLLPAFNVRIIMPAMGQDRPPPFPIPMISHFLIVFARCYLGMRRQVPKLIPPVVPGLRHVLHALAPPVLHLDTAHLTLHSPEAQLDMKYFDVTTTKGEQRVLCDLAKLYARIQQILGAGGLMQTSDQVKTVSALVAAKLATLRTSGVAASKINTLLDPVLSIAKLLRPRAGTKKQLSQRRQAYLVGILLQRATDMEEVLENAIWTKNWPVVPADLKTTDGLIPKKAAKSSPKGTTTASGAHCGPRRKASAARIDPRATHLRGSGAVVT